MNKRLIGYTRVSTSMQHESGGGLQAQETMIRNFCKENNFFLLDIYTEAHSGADNDRPILMKAIEACQEQGAGIVVAKIDRLSRRMSFITSFKEKYNVDFYVANLGLDVNKTMLYLLVIFAELERDMISKRVKEGIAQKKREGTYKKPPGNKNLNKDGKDGKNQIARRIKRENHRKQIFKELEFIYKRYLEKEAENIAQQKRKDEENIESEKLKKKKERQNFYAPDRKYYFNALNERGNKTFHKKEWNADNFKKFVHDHSDELSLYNIKIRDGRVLLD